MLGNMTAGLPEYLANADFREAFFAEPNRVWTPYELLDYAFEAPNSFDPGESSSYSNANTVVLGLVVERAAGKPFHQVLEEKILKPLDLSGTGFPLNELFTGDHVNGYFASFLPTRPETDSTFWSPSQAWAAGQMVSTVDDLTRWIRTIGNGSLVGPSLQAERLKWEPIGDNNDVWHYTFGLEENSGWLGHNGEIPGFDTFAVYHPQLDATIVIVINTDKRVDGQPPINVLLRNLSGVFFPGHTVEVPVVG
jgi:D-alanyl-D-alanine carboxypeptidase